MLPNSLSRDKVRKCADQRSSLSSTPAAGCQPLFGSPQEQLLMSEAPPQIPVISADVYSLLAALQHLVSSKWTNGP